MAHIWILNSLDINFPKLFQGYACKWVLAIIAEWLLCGNSPNRHIPYNPHSYQGRRPAAILSSQQRTLVFEQKRCTVYPAAEGSLSSDVKVYHDVTTIHKELQLMPCEVRPISTLSLLGTSQSERQKQGQRSGLCIILFHILQTP